jgi:hypothetical protein
MSRAVVALALAGLAGCIGMSVAKIEPARATFAPDRRAVAMQAAIDELARRGFTKDAMDPASGVVRTKWSERPDQAPCGLGTCPHRDQIEVIVAPDGATVLSVRREFKTETSTMGGTPNVSWIPISEGQRSSVEGVQKDQRELLDAIVSSAAAR